MLELKNVSKIYARRGTEVRAADNASFTVENGELLAIQGPSGSGKSTLLLIMGAMLKPDRGTVLFNGTPLYKKSATLRNRIRRNHIGFLFQRFFLIPYLSVKDNIRMPLRLRGDRAGENKISDLAEQLGITHRLDHRPFELSVGEQQRAALARAIVAEPDLILADEPTGNLDTENSEIIADCLVRQSREGRTVIMVTHSTALPEIATRRLHLADGKIVPAP